VGFFETFWAWLNGQLLTYIGDNTARVAGALEPALMVVGTLYIMAWGYLQLTGGIEEPAVSGLKRIGLLALVFGGSLRLWLYNSVIVDTFFAAPAALAGSVVGSPNPVATIDSIWNQGGAVADFLWNKGGVFGGDFGFYIAGAAVWILIGLLCIYTMFLIALSTVATSVLLALGPLFIAMLLFGATRRFFSAWIAQLATYGLVTIMTVLLGALLLQIVNTYAAQTAARGSAIVTVDALDMVLVAALVLLLMRQVMPIASGLAGGLALSTYGAVSSLTAWTLGRTATGVRAGLSYASERVSGSPNGLVPRSRVMAE